MDNQKGAKNTSQATKFKVEENSRTFQDCANPSLTHIKSEIYSETVKNSSCLVIQLLPTDGHRDEKFGKVADQEQSRAVTMTPQRRTDRQLVHKLGR